MKFKFQILIVAFIVPLSITISAAFAAGGNRNSIIPRGAGEVLASPNEIYVPFPKQMEQSERTNKDNYVKQNHTVVNSQNIPADGEILSETFPPSPRDENESLLWELVAFPSLPAGDPCLTKSEDGYTIYWAATVDDSDHPHPFFRVYKSTNLGGNWDYVCGVYDSSYAYEDPDIVVTETRIILVGTSGYDGYSIFSASWDLDGDDFHAAYIATDGYRNASLSTDAIDYSESATWLYCSFLDASAGEIYISYSTDLAEPSWSSPCIVSDGDEPVTWMTPAQAMAYADNTLFTVFRDSGADIWVSIVSIFDLCNPEIRDVASSSSDSLEVPCIAAYQSQILVFFCTNYNDGDWDIAYDFSMDQGNTWDAEDHGYSYSYWPQEGTDGAPGIDVSVEGLYGIMYYSANSGINYWTGNLPVYWYYVGLAEEDHYTNRSIAVVMPSNPILDPPEDYCAGSWEEDATPYFAWSNPIPTYVGDDPNSGLPTCYSLSGNYPNPFNARTTIEYALAGASDVRFAIYNLLGQRVTTLFEGAKKAGEHTIMWDATDFPSGVYFYRIEAGEFAETKKMLLLK